MGKIVLIMGASGEGKTTSTVINPDGTFDMKNYKGLNPASHFIINLDKKALPFPGKLWGPENKNYIETDEMDKIREVLTWVSKQERIKTVALDTINVFLAMKEYNERQKLNFDQWRSLANDIIEINSLCNGVLRDDQIVYMFNHTMLQTQADGSEKIVSSVVGQKLKQIQPEAFYSIVLMSNVSYDDMGGVNYSFITKPCKSSVKAPIGMFTETKIPNSLSLIDSIIREYYSLPKIEYGLPSKAK